jgi:hypothetical protein
MAVSRDEVILGFRLILGREPDSETAIAAHMELPDLGAMARVLFQSAEFSQNARFKDFLQVQGGAPAASSGTGRVSPQALNVVVFGNCQANTIGRLIRAMTGGAKVKAIETAPSILQQIDRGEFDLAALLADCDLIYVQLITELTQAIQTRHPEHADKIRQFPPVHYAAFHPDCVYVRQKHHDHLEGPMRGYHSSIALWAWQQGWSVREALALFDPQVYELLGFHSYDEASRKVLLEWGERSGVAMEPLLYRWMSGGLWMHSVNHPRLPALADLTAELLRREGIEPLEEALSGVEDSLARAPVWPVYPPIAARFGFEGDYVFKPDQGPRKAARVTKPLSLEEFVRASFKCYDAAGAGNIDCDRTRSAAYEALTALRPVASAAGGAPSFLSRALEGKLGRWMGNRQSGAAHDRAMPRAAPVLAASSANPYANLPEFHFWRRVVESVPAEDVDPVVAPRWQITQSDKLATAGSCFAQHLSRTLSNQGFNYFVAEDGAGLPEQERGERQFGVFSARYGNIYTARQLVQLFDRAYGRLLPVDRAWRRGDGRFVDPFRPQVEPGGFATADEVHAAATQHLAAVRILFEQMDVFVFTLGLTESWLNRGDGSVFPLAPGVVASPDGSSSYSFVNFGFTEVLNDIRGAVRRIRSVNPAARLMFTVSPVPLIATYESRHVLVSTVESKSVLRAAIGQVAREDLGVAYFPSYEIITGQHARGRYFAPDLRSVTEDGVGHVMRVFLRNYTGQLEQPIRAVSASASGSAAFDAVVAEQRALQSIVCDEEAIDGQRASGEEMP